MGVVQAKIQLSLLLANPSLDTTLALERAPYPNIPLGYLYVENEGLSIML